MAYITDNNGSKVSVTINDVMQKIVNAINLTQDEWMEWYDEDDYKRENVTYDENGNISDDTLGNCSYPVRLQVVDGSWYFHTGDNSYDTDHRGAWGYGYASYGMNKTAVRDLARDLITEAMNS
jgi:hypothetical protein